MSLGEDLAGGRPWGETRGRIATTAVLDFFPARTIVNKGVPGGLVTLLAGVGFGLALGKLLIRQPVKDVSPLPVPVEPIRRSNPLAVNRLKGYLDAERN